MREKLLSLPSSRLANCHESMTRELFLDVGNHLSNIIAVSKSIKLCAFKWNSTGSPIIEHNSSTSTFNDSIHQSGHNGHLASTKGGR